MRLPLFPIFYPSSHARPSALRFELYRALILFLPGLRPFSLSFEATGARGSEEAEESRVFVCRISVVLFSLCLSFFFESYHVATYASAGVEVGCARRPLQGRASCRGDLIFCSSPQPCVSEAVPPFEPVDRFRHSLRWFSFVFSSIRWAFLQMFRPSPFFSVYLPRLQRMASLAVLGFLLFSLGVRRVYSRTQKRHPHRQTAGGLSPPCFAGGWFLFRARSRRFFPRYLFLNPMLKKVHRLH